MKKVAFYTLGCKVNQYETEAMLELFEKVGYEKAETEDYADVHVINTCTVTHMSDRKSRQYIRRMKKKNQTTIEQTSGKRLPDKTKEYVIGNTIYIVNSFFDENSKSSVSDIIERLATREINKNIA